MSTESNPPVAGTPSAIGSPTGGELLLQFLADCDEPCPLCGYNLRGLRSPRCPECGEALALAVLPPPGLHRPWGVFVAALSICAGVGVVWVAITLKEGFEHFRRGPDAVGFVKAYAVLAIPLAAMALTFRLKLLRHPRKTQWALAVISVAACAAMWIVFAMYYQP